MERLTEVTHFERQAVPLDQARFADPLPAEYEETWRQILDNVRAMDGRDNYKATMRELWADKTLPIAFRDRAMLRIIGSQKTRRALDPDSDVWRDDFTFGGPYRAQPAVLRELGPLAEKFQPWLKDAFKYDLERRQNATCSLVENTKYLELSVQLFADGHISEAELNEYLDQIDVKTSVPRYIDEDRDVPDNYFPLLDHILEYEKLFDSRLKGWAAQKLGDWIDKQAGRDVEIPAWLEKIDIVTQLRQYRKLFSEALKVKAPDAWERFKPILPHYDLGYFIADPLLHADTALSQVYEISDPLVRIGAFDYVLRSQAGKTAKQFRFTVPPGEVTFPLFKTQTQLEEATALVEQLGDPVLKSIMENEVKLTTAHLVNKDRYAAQSAARAIERQQEFDRIEQHKKDASSKLANLLRELRPPAGSPWELLCEGTVSPQSAE